MVVTMDRIKRMGTWAALVTMGVGLAFVGGCVSQSTTTIIEPNAPEVAEVAQVAAPAVATGARADTASMDASEATAAPDSSATSATQAVKTRRASTFWIKEAPLPEGWPALTPVGVVQVKDYPDTRAAVVRRDSSHGSTGRASGGMFRSLFNHIKSRDIAMTAPVDMGYRDDETQAMTSMAFLYRRPDQGVTETNGTVSVENFAARPYVSIGLRGGYNDDRFGDALAAIDQWLEANADTWQADGPPRYLGYNSPFVPGMMKYGEVQRPVRPAGD